MPRTQTTGVEVVVRARAIAARTELKGLRKDVAEFGTFVRQTLKGVGGGKVAAPVLSSEWRKLEREITEIAGNIRKQVESINNLRLKPLSVGTFLRNTNTNATTAAGQAPNLPAPSAPTVRPPSRSAEIQEAARLTREWQAGTRAADDYRAELERIARTATAGSEKQIDALQRVAALQRKAAQEAAQAEANNRARQSRRHEAGELASSMTQRAGDLMTVGVTAPLVAGFAAASKEAISYEAALRNVNSIAQVSEKQFNELYKQVLKIADDPGVTQGPTDLAKALYELQSSGFSVTAGINDPKNALQALKVASQGATAGLTDTATASNGLIAVLNSGIGGVANAQEAMNLLFQTVNDGKLTFGELASTIGSVLPTATKAGLTFQEVGGAIAMMTVQGQSAGEASNDLLNLITKIANPSQEAEKQFRALGISFGFSGLQAKGLPGILEEINKKTGGNADAIKRLLPDMQAQRAALMLLKGDVSEYNKFVAQQAKANEGVGATQRALSQQTKSFQYEMDKLRQEFQKLAAEVGPAFIRALREGLTAIRPFINAVKDLAERFAKLTPEQQQTVIKMLAVAAATGPVISGLGRMAGGITDAVRLFQLLRPEAAATGVTLATQTAPGIAATGASAVTAAGQVGRFQGILTGLAKIGRIGITVAIAVLGAEVLGQAIRYLDKLAGGGLADWLAGLAQRMGADAETVARIRRDGVPTLFDTAGMAWQAGKEGIAAYNANKEADNAPFAVARKDEGDARARRQQAYTRSARFAGIYRQETNQLSYEDGRAVTDEYRRRGRSLPRDLSGNIDYRRAAQDAARWNAQDAEREAGNIRGAQTRQGAARNQQRRETGTQQFGGSLGRLTPNPGVNLGGLDPRTKNVISAVAGSRAGGRIVSVTRNKAGQQVITVEGITPDDAERVQEGLTEYGMGRVKRGETAQGVASTLQARRSGNRVVITVTPPKPSGGRTGGGGGRSGGTGVVQPPPRPGRDNAGAAERRVRPFDANDVPQEEEKNRLRGFTDQYTEAFTKYGDRAQFMSEADRKQAQTGLFGLANRIRESEEKIAAAKLKEAEDAAAHARQEAAELAKNAKNQADKDRAADMVKKADNDEAKARVMYAGEMAEIQSRHSERYRAIYKAQEGTAQEIAEREARDAEQREANEAKKHEQRIAEIDEQLKYTQDATERDKLINERFAETQAAIDARYRAAMAAAKGMQNRFDRERAERAAGDEKTAAERDLARDRGATTRSEAIDRAEAALRILEQQAGNLDDLTAKHQKLLEVDAARLEILRLQGATQAQIDAQAEANNRAARERQAEIARQNAQALLIRSRTEGMASFAPAGTDPAQAARIGAEEFRKQLSGVFASEYNDTTPTGRGGVVNAQLTLLTRAVEIGLLSFEQLLPLLQEMEQRVNASGDFEASNAFYKNVRDLFGDQLKQRFTEFDRKNGTDRQREYNALIEGIRSGREFGNLSDAQKQVVVKLVEEKRDKKDDDEVKDHTGIRRIGDDAARDILQSADRHSADFVAAIFGNHDRGKKAIEEFWGDVLETGRRSMARAVNDAILKPIGKRITDSLSGVFERGADNFDKALTKSGGVFDKVFKNGVSGILQAVVYLNGVLALAGKSGGRRGKKGGVLGAIAGVGIGIATGGTGLALLGAGLTGASAGSQVANGDYLGALVSVGSGFMPGGSFAGKPGVAKPATPAKAYGGAASRGVAYSTNEHSQWYGPEVFVPNTDGLIIPSAAAVGQLPTVARANNELLRELSAIVGGSGGGSGDTFVMNDYGDKYSEVDGDRTIRKFARELRDGMNRRS